VSIKRAIPADESGEAGAENFTLSYGQKMSMQEFREMGAFRALLCDDSGNIVAGVSIEKNVAGQNAKLDVYVNNLKKFGIVINVFRASSNAIAQATITKQGDSVTFNVCGYIWTFKDTTITNTPVTSVTFSFLKYGSYTQLNHNALSSIKFVKNNCETWKEIPNKFSANDVVEADCKSGKIYLNGIEAPEYGALGNDWEEFYLKPGLNQFGFSYSEWTEQAPSFKVKYREVFL
jgi:hypothetical protein